MTRPLEVADCVELAVLVRSGMAESRHIGVAAVVGADGLVIDRLGDPSALVYPRSALKPLQATAVSDTGVAFSEVELVLAAASHAGTPRHVEVVRSMLGSAGLTETDLRCPADFPADPDTRRLASEKRRITHNCSGKHAAFLSGSVAAGFDTASYLEAGHPLQAAALTAIESYIGERVTHSAIDGCGMPLHAVSVTGLATGMARLTASGHPIVAAVRANPWALDGAGRANTTVIERTGAIAKGGFEGVLVIATEQAAVAVKVLDGSPRVATLVALSLMARAGVIDATVAQETAHALLEPVLGGTETVGGFQVSF